MRASFEMFMLKRYLMIFIFDVKKIFMLKDIWYFKGRQSSRYFSRYFSAFLRLSEPSFCLNYSFEKSSSVIFVFLAKNWSKNMYHPFNLEMWNWTFLDLVAFNGFGLADVCSSEANDDAVFRSAVDTSDSDLLTSLIKMANRYKRIVFYLTCDTMGAVMPKQICLIRLIFQHFWILF